MRESRIQHSDQAVVVALGANLAGRFADPGAAVEAALEDLPRYGFQVAARSRLWRSAAWPDPSDPPFVNAVAIVRTPLGPDEALAALHDLEAAFGRGRGVLNAPRSLDLDLIAYGRLVIEDGAATLPHPRAAERLFVMGPLAEIAPEWVHPVLGATAEALTQRVTAGLDARPIES